MASNSQIVAAFSQVPLLVKKHGASYFDHMLEWRRMTELYLLEQCAHLVQIGYKCGLHFELLRTTLGECGNLVRNREITEAHQLPTQEQLWDVLKNNRAYVYSPNRKAWYPESPHAAEYAVPGNLFANIKPANTRSSSLRSVVRSRGCMGRRRGGGRGRRGHSERSIKTLWPIATALSALTSTLPLATAPFLQKFSVPESSRRTVAFRGPCDETTDNPRQVLGFPAFSFSPSSSLFLRLRSSARQSSTMPPTGSLFWPIFQKVPIKPTSRGPPYFNGLEAWRRSMASYLDQHFGNLAPGHSGAIHLEALETILEECGKLVQNGTISWTTHLPTAEQLWDMVVHNRIYAFDPAHLHWYPNPQLSDYTVAGNLLPSFPGQHSLLKPEIGRRVARKHGTTKARWERDARAF
ncbi:hypothetical protein OF846_003669 [Rhodotorula toruloides]|nr:hypothetical protein OF846_003669 [Rhodotorula toruloides]